MMMPDLPVDSSQHVRETVSQPAWLRALAQLLSILFHPLFIPFYLAVFLLKVHPYASMGLSPLQKTFKLISIFVSTAFFPAFTVFLMSRLGLASSITLKTQKERIIPIIASMIFYFWVFYVSKNQAENPPMLTEMLLAVFIGSIAALMCNIYFKISLHAIAMGSMVTFFIYVALNTPLPMGFYLSLALLVAGLVCTARMIVSDHFLSEIWAGFFVGVLCQLLAFVFL
jgi:hypothetical protein